MKILSLFDGMACGAIAFIEGGYSIDRYVAFEIDKYAVKTSSHNFPFIEHKGDVFEADFSQYEGFDFLVGGSPCTYWSIAQKNNRETEASGMGWELFSQYVRALREAKPKYFIYENNKSMSNAIRESISSTFGFEPICINSALVSAQNRQRLYWCGVRQEDGTYAKADIPQPEDRGILLKDILESGGDLTSNDKSYALTASYNGAVAWNTIERNQRNMVAEPVNTTADGKSRTIKAQYHKNAVSNFCCYNGTYGASGVAEKVSTVQKDNNVAEPIRVGALPRPNGELSTSQAFRIYSTEGKSININAGGGGAGGKTGLYAIPVEFENGIPTKAISCADGKTYDVYRVKDGQITIKGKQYPIKLADGFYIIRKLTVRECMRLQTVPEWYEFPVSDSQAYKMLGNGWTVDVIRHLIKYTLSSKVIKPKTEEYEQLEWSDYEKR